MADTMLVDYVRVYQKQTFPANVEELNSNNLFTFFPNPLNKRSQLNIHFNQSNTYNVEIVDMYGKVLHHETLNVNNSNNKYSISLDHFPSGHYILKCRSNEILLNERFVILE